MRVLKYLYDALNRHLIESFEQSLLERTGHLEISYEEFIESTELQRFVSSPTKESLKALSDGHSEVIAQIHIYESSLLTGVLGPTARVWVSFLQMVQILLETGKSIYNQRSTCCRGCLRMIDQTIPAF